MSEPNTNTNNYNQNNFKKFNKIDYKMIFLISFVLNFLFVYLFYYYYSIPLNIRVRDLYNENQSTYSQILNIKEVVNTVK